MLKVKVWYIIIFFVILMISLTFISKYILVDTTNDIQVLLNDMQINLRKSNYNEAAKDLNSLNIKWSQYKSKWAVLVEHQEIDKIDEQISRIKELMKLNEEKDLQTEISVLKFYVKHVKDMTSLEIENIF